MARPHRTISTSSSRRSGRSRQTETPIGRAGKGRCGQLPLQQMPEPYFVETAGLPPAPNFEGVNEAPAEFRHEPQPQVTPGPFDAHAIKRDVPILNQSVNGR